MDDQRVQNIIDEHSKAQELNAQLQAVLVSLTPMDTTAFDIVKNTKKTCGLDAWRRFVHEFDTNEQPCCKRQAAPRGSEASPGGSGIS